jgi:hydrogenase/urease accessory protein HupE
MRRAASAVAGLALLPGPAWAHAPLAGIGDFRAGLLHPLSDLPAILPLLALGLLTGQAGRVDGLIAALAGIAAALGGGAVAVQLGWWPAAPTILALSTLTAALLVAADIRLHQPVLLAVAGMLGATLGATQASTLPTAGFAMGVAVGISLAALYFQAAVARITPVWARIGFRVLGSWLAAIQLMMLGLELR